MRYQCWCPMDKLVPNEFIEAPTSFAARQEFARRHHKQITDCVATRRYDVLVQPIGRGGGAVR